MDDVTKDRAARSFAERLREAVEESQDATDVRARRRHKHRRVTTPLSAQPTDPARVRPSDELFVDRLRRALD